LQQIAEIIPNDPAIFFVQTRQPFIQLRVIYLKD